MPCQLHDTMLFRSQCLIDGCWIDADDASVIAVDNPADGSPLGTVPACGRAETRRAIEAAAKAQILWKKKSPLERSAYLRAWEELIQKHTDDLARILTLEQGKPLAEARGEVLQGASYFPWFAEEGRRLYGETVQLSRPGVQALTRRSPVGVAAAVTPWNFPSAMIPRKVAPALAAGCTIIIKPSGRTPYSALALGELAQRAGIPAGVVNVVTGKSSDVGGELTDNPIVRKISFTGSTDVGKSLAAACAPTLKRLSLELGGNAPFIVFDDADLDAAVALAMACKFRNAGQTCICANRILVQRGIFATFAERLTAAAAALRVGNGLSAEVDMGPMIHADAVARVHDLVRDALAQGAVLRTGGKHHALGGNFYEPTVLTGLTPAMQAFRHEIFGPVAALAAFDTEDEAVALANDTEYGLASYVCTRDLGTSWRMFNQLEYGMVGINDVALASAETPFGGVKYSGQGREGGREGIQDYLETRYALMGGLL